MQTIACYYDYLHASTSELINQTVRFIFTSIFLIAVYVVPSVATLRFFIS